MSLDVIIPPSSATPYQLVPAGDVVIVVATTRRSGGRLSHIRHMLSLLSRDRMTWQRILRGVRSAEGRGQIDQANYTRPVTGR